jgi:hypothetical protein
MDVFASLAVSGKTRRANRRGKVLANGDLAYALPFSTGSRMFGGAVVEVIDCNDAQGIERIPQLTAWGAPAPSQQVNHTRRTDDTAIP